MTINVNLDGVEAWSGGAAIPPGQHTCQIDEATEGQSAGGYPQVELLLRVVEGEATGASGRDWIIVTQATLGKVRQFLEAAGCQIPAGEFSFPTGQLVGRRVDVTVRQEEYGGKTRTRVVAYEGAPANGATAVPAMAGAPGPTSASRDDDIPF